MLSSFVLEIPISSGIFFVIRSHMASHISVKANTSNLNPFIPILDSGVIALFVNNTLATYDFISSFCF